jgi:hypothetical protein
MTMTKEIATELRRGVGNGDPGSVRKAEELMDRAAAEIDRLTRDLAQAQAEAVSLRRHNEGLDKNVTDLEAQNERLRAGLDRACDALLSSELASDRDTATEILNAAYPRHDEQRATPARPQVVGRVTGKIYDGDQVPGMPHAICHACGLKDYPCTNPDCPNTQC